MIESNHMDFSFSAFEFLWKFELEFEGCSVIFVVKLCDEYFFALMLEIKLSLLVIDKVHTSELGSKATFSSVNL